MDFSNIMEIKEKSIIKAKFGNCIQKIIEENKIAAKASKQLNSGNDYRAITSLRKLAAASGVEFSIIQKISAGKRNPELSTIVAIADGFGIGLSELFRMYESVTLENNIVKKSKNKLLLTSRIGKK